MAASIPPIDTSFGQDSTDTTTSTSSTTVGAALYKSSFIPAHSSLPSPLSPPLSVSPPSLGSMTMATLALASPPSPQQHTSTSPHLPIAPSSLSPSPSISSLPPRHPSENNNNNNNNNNNSTTNDLSHPHLSRVGLAASSLPLIQTSPEQWLQHAAQQRRHVSTGSFSSTTSTTPSHFSSYSPSVSQSPTRLAFSESEQPDNMNNLTISSASGTVSASACPSDDEEPMFDMNVRPSVLRASLMARAQRSSASNKKRRSESMPYDQGSRLSMQSNMSSISGRSYSFSSTFESHPSARSSTSSIGNWAPRARSSSVSSQGSTGSVNLDAIIASESDLNEEKPLELVEGDEVDWTTKEERPVVENVLPSLPSLPLMTAYPVKSRTSTHYEDQGDEHWGSISENEIGDDEDDEEFGEALREFSQMSLKTNSGVQIRGLGYSSSGLPSSSRISAPSSRFPPKKNPFDLDADYMNSPGFDDLRSGSRSSTYSNSTGTASNRSSISKMPTPTSSLVQPKSGLKAPGASRLAQPGARSSIALPKPSGSRGTTQVAPKTGLQAPRSGLQAPRTGLQAPKTGLQAPRAGLQAPRTGASSTTRTPTKPGMAPRTGSSSTLAKPQAKPTASRTLPSPTSRIGTTTRSQVPPTVKRPNIPTSTSNRTSLLQAPASFASRSSGTVGATVARMNASHSNNNNNNNTGLTSPKRNLTMPGLVSPTRGIRPPGGSMVSPTSSQSSTSSLPSLGYGARDSSQRLLNATGASASSSSLTKSRLMGPRIATGRTVSMYGSLNMEEDYEDDRYYDDHHHDYAVLTPPHSPSASKSGSRLSMAPTRLAIPTTTSRIGRPSSPMALTGRHIGLVSPKAGVHHRY